MKKYDSYLNVIKSGVSSAIDSLIEKITSSSNLTQKIEAPSNWTGDANDALKAKIDQFGQKFSGFLSETDNLSNIKSGCSELEKAIERYNKLLDDLEKEKSLLNIEIANNKALKDFEKSHSDRKILQMENNIFNFNSEIKHLDSEIEGLIKKIQGITFGVKSIGASLNIAPYSAMPTTSPQSIETINSEVQSPVPPSAPASEPQSTPLAESPSAPSTSTNVSSSPNIDSKKLLNYKSNNSITIGSKDWNRWAKDHPEELQELMEEHDKIVKEAKESGGIPAALVASATFFPTYGLNIYGGSGSKSPYSPDGLFGTNSDKRPNSVEWLQVLYEQITGERDANFRLKKPSTSLNGEHFAGNISREIDRVSTGDIFFDAPKNSGGVGHLYLVVDKIGDNFVTQEMKNGGWVISVKTKSELSRLDGLTILDKKTI